MGRTHRSQLQHCDDLIAVHKRTQPGIGKGEVLGGAEQHAAAAHFPAVFIQQAIGIVALPQTIAGEILLGQPHRAEGGTGNLEAAAFDDGQRP